MDPSPLDAAGLERVRQWFLTEARDYPWTQTEDPYAIWISEIMLQQTVVTAAIVPYETWMRRWPTLVALAATDESQVLRAWEGLGYASRAKNLHRAAVELVKRGQSTLPDEEESLRSLPGIGEYTAAAILSFAFHRPTLTLDANLKRVFQRLDATAEWTPELETRWRQIWGSLVDGPTSRASNQGVMQLGQRVCRSKAPLCELCPLSSGCRSRSMGVQSQIPAAKARSTIEKATTVVFWHRDQGRSWWLARPTSGRFSNLWLVPPGEPTFGNALSPRTHTYTKYRDRLTPFSAPWQEEGHPPMPDGWTGRWSTVAEAQDLGMVSVYRKILDEALGSEI